MKKYRYNGELEVHVAMIGNVKPGKTIDSQEPINHPDFEEIIDEKELQKQPKVINK